ncbi:MAG: LON peptidase substrate-binding domain-containing protein [Candidatus Dormibacteria bacterium]
MAIEIALFPLNAVLFPHMPMALHIFEERYRVMLRDCRESGTTFGVVGIRQGSEVGYGAEPYRVGTLAQLEEIDELPDGRYNIVVEGASRFRVDSFRLERAYLTGTVTYLEDAPASHHGTALAATVRSQFLEYLTRVRALSRQDDEQEHEELDLPDEPELLSYLVAAALQVRNDERQQLLEMNAADARLRACHTLLRRELVVLEHMLGRAATPVATFSPN